MLVLLSINLVRVLVMSSASERLTLSLNTFLSPAWALGPRAAKSLLSFFFFYVHRQIFIYIVNNSVTEITKFYTT